MDSNLPTNFEFGQPSIGLSSDEGGKILGGYAFSQQNQLAFAAAFSNLWDGKDINKVRAGSGSSNFAGRRVSLHLSIQPMIAQKLFANEEIKDQGLLSRILVVMPDSLKGSRTLREDKESQRQRLAANEVLQRFGEQVTRLLKKRAKCSDDNRQELTPQTLRLSSESRRQLVDFYNLVETQQADDGLYANISGLRAKRPNRRRVSQAFSRSSKMPMQNGLTRDTWTSPSL